MKVISIRKQKDGSALMTLELDKNEYSRMLIGGMQLMVGDKAKVLSIEESKLLGIKGTKKYEISDEEARQCIELFVVEALRQAIRKHKAVKKAKK